MGGMNNKISKDLSKARSDSKNYHVKQNQTLYKEYTESGSQYTMTFLEWKQSKKKKK